MNDDQKLSTDSKAISAPQKLFWQALSLGVGATISGLVGLAFFIYKRGRDNKDHLLVTVSLLSGELERHSDPLRFYDESLARLEEAVFRVRPFLRESKRHVLSTIWNRYREARTILQQADKGEPPDQSIYEWMKTIGADCPRPKDRREIIQWFHRKFTEVVS